MYILDDRADAPFYIIRTADGREFVRVSRSNPIRVVLAYFGIQPKEGE